MYLKERLHKFKEKYGIMDKVKGMGLLIDEAFAILEVVISEIVG